MINLFLVETGQILNYNENEGLKDIATIYTISDIFHHRSV